MQVRLFIQRMQVTVLERCCADGMGCHVHAELRAGNKQCAKIPRRDIKACHFQLSLHKSRRVCGRLQTVNYEESRACPKVTGPMTMQERKSTWAQKDRARIWSWLSKLRVCMKKIDAIVMSALHSVAQAQLGPACRSDHKEDNHLAANVNGNAAGRKNVRATTTKTDEHHHTLHAKSLICATQRCSRGVRPCLS